MYIYHSDNTITIKCHDGEFRTYVFTDEEFSEYIKTGEFDFENHVEVSGSAI